MDSARLRRVGIICQADSALNFLVCLGEVFGEDCRLVCDDFGLC